MPVPSNSNWAKSAHIPTIDTSYNDYSHAHRLPEASRATRKVSFRSRTSVRGIIPVWLEAPQCVRRIFFESKMELIFILLATTSGKVVDLWEQPPAVPYRDADGKERRHVFDFLATMADGQRFAVAVKPQERVLAKGFDRDLSLIKRQLPEAFADDVILFSDAHYTAANASNALRFHELSKQPDLEADMAISLAASSLNGALTIAKLCTTTGLAGRAYRAAFRAVMTGVLKPLSRGPINPRTVVMKGVTK